MAELFAIVLWLRKERSLMALTSWPLAVYKEMDMIRTRLFLLLALLGGIFFTCQTSAQSTGSAQKPPTPEEIRQIWRKHLEAARKLADKDPDAREALAILEKNACLAMPKPDGYEALDKPSGARENIYLVIVTSRHRSLGNLWRTRVNALTYLLIYPFQTSIQTYALLDRSDTPTKWESTLLLTLGNRIKRTSAVTVPTEQIIKTTERQIKEFQYSLLARVGGEKYLQLRQEEEKRISEEVEAEGKKWENATIVPPLKIYDPRLDIFGRPQAGLEEMAERLMELRGDAYFHLNQKRAPNQKAADEANDIFVGKALEIFIVPSPQGPNTKT